MMEQSLSAYTAPVRRPPPPATLERPAEGSHGALDLSSSREEGDAACEEACVFLLGVANAGTRFIQKRSRQTGEGARDGAAKRSM
jgi:hypothetical protein